MDTDTDLNGTNGSLSEHLHEKWKHFFQFFDTDNDRFWTKADMLILSDRFIREAGNLLSESGAHHIRKQSQHWLTTQEQELCNVQPGEITEPIITERLQRLLLAKKKNKRQLKELDIVSEIFFDIIDINRDGKISRKELAVFYKSSGIQNEHVIQMLFRGLDLVGDGNVTREEFRIAYREYFFGDQRVYNQPIALLFNKIGLLTKQREMFYNDD